MLKWKELFNEEKGIAVWDKIKMICGEKGNEIHWVIAESPLKSMTWLHILEKGGILPYNGKAKKRPPENLQRPKSFIALYTTIKCISIERLLVFLIYFSGEYTCPRDPFPGPIPLQTTRTTLHMPHYVRT